MHRWRMRGRREGLVSVFTVVNVDPHVTPERGSIVTAQLGWPLSFTVRDVVFGECFPWRIGANYFRVERCQRRNHVDRVDVSADLRR